VHRIDHGQHSGASHRPVTLLRSGPHQRNARPRWRGADAEHRRNKTPCKTVFTFSSFFVFFERVYFFNNKDVQKTNKKLENVKTFYTVFFRCSLSAPLQFGRALR